MKTKVSVVMSVFNQEKYLARAISSILAQTFRDFEFLILDDGSVDKSLTIIKSFKDKRIRIFRHKERKGLAKGLNFLIRKAKGKYIARMDGDDISMPERFAKQVTFLENHPRLALIGSWAKIINGKGKVIGNLRYPTQYSQLRKVILSYNTFVHPSIMFRREILEKVGNYDENFFYSQDYDLVLRIVARFPCRNIPDFLLKFRWPPSFEKQKVQHLTALKIRWKAIKQYNYSLWEVIKLIKPLVLYLFPVSLKRLYWRQKLS